MATTFSSSVFIFILSINFFMLLKVFLMQTLSVCQNDIFNQQKCAGNCRCFSGEILVFTTILLMSITVNANILPKDHNHCMSMTYLNFVALISLSFFELSVPALIGCSLSCLVVFASAAIIQERPLIVAQLVVVSIGAFLGVALGVLRSNRTKREFIVGRRAQWQKNRCENLLSMMLPTKEFAVRLMNGESVVEVNFQWMLLFMLSMFLQPERLSYVIMIYFFYAGRSYLTQQSSTRTFAVSLLWLRKCRPI